jgi:hypothetical protein
MAGGGSSGAKQKRNLPKPKLTPLKLKKPVFLSRFLARGAKKRIPLNTKKQESRKNIASRSRCDNLSIIDSNEMKRQTDQFSDILYSIVQKAAQIDTLDRFDPFLATFTKETFRERVAKLVNGEKVEPITLQSVDMLQNGKEVIHAQSTKD